MTISSRPCSLQPAIRAFLEGLAELIAEDLLRHTGGERVQPREAEDHTTNTHRS